MSLFLFLSLSFLFKSLLALNALLIVTAIVHAVHAAIVHSPCRLLIKWAEVSKLRHRMPVTEIVEHSYQHHSTFRVDQNRISAPYMTVCMVILLLKVPCVHRIYL